MKRTRAEIPGEISVCLSLLAFRSRLPDRNKCAMKTHTYLELHWFSGAYHLIIIISLGPGITEKCLDLVSLARGNKSGKPAMKAQCRILFVTSHERNARYHTFAHLPHTKALSFSQRPSSKPTDENHHLHDKEDIL
ncbi:hypothetical protein EYC80_003353 [Monilinia laxa]|uniref:Uncharacterized protein n=1 Tax=Monilinia laxa TaxID=61186 RepID=A0A5N6KDH4_MONLA|nr:hypothetical protein EYC80_003353 [Monilinia laxa]